VRITFVIQWPNLSGGIRVVTTYAQRLKQRGHQVVVVSSLPREKIPVRRKVKSLLLGRGLPKMKEEPSYLHQSGVEHQPLEAVRPAGDTDMPDADVVVATYWRTAYAVQPLPPSKGAKAILIQGYDAAEGESNPRLEATWRMPMHKIVISRWLLDLAQNTFKDPVVSLVPNSVDLDQFKAPARQKQAVPTVGVIYSRSWFKGYRTSLAALKQVAAVLPSLRVVCFGTERPGWALPLPPGAEFRHRPSQQELRALYAQCDVWLCGSNREGFALPPLEAMACRCPVVTTRVGAQPDLIEGGVNGHLVEVGDATTLAERVLRVLKLPPAAWERMSEAAHRTATGYTWDDATERFERALETAIERGRGGDLSKHLDAAV
jgi:glycosyltransferase involved in cell wall biosynthesis